eukprot:maker-scaffold3429_size8701-snap-gene-0.3 protein:Tk12385 transcript:maker-scaffold3429_size8701-snap-gene-0.3-mRNA-1 annotation:"ninein isoform 1"
MGRCSTLTWYVWSVTVILAFVYYLICPFVIEDELKVVRVNDSATPQNQSHTLLNQTDSHPELHDPLEDNTIESMTWTQKHRRAVTLGNSDLETEMRISCGKNIEKCFSWFVESVTGRLYHDARASYQYYEDVIEVAEEMQSVWEIRQSQMLQNLAQAQTRLVQGNIQNNLAMKALRLQNSLFRQQALDYIANSTERF